MTVLTTVEAGEGSGEKGGRGGGVARVKERTGLKRAQNDITFIHRFPRSPLIFRVQISLCLTLYLGRGRSGYHTLLRYSPLLTKRSLRDFGDVEVV